MFQAGGDHNMLKEPISLSALDAVPQRAQVWVCSVHPGVFYTHMLVLKIGPGLS